MLLRDCYSLSSLNGNHTVGLITNTEEAFVCKSYQMPQLPTTSSVTGVTTERASECARYAGHSSVPFALRLGLHNLRAHSFAMEIWGGHIREIGIANSIDKTSTMKVHYIGTYSL